MGQGDILDLLLNQKKWMTAYEISNILGISKASTDASLRRLRRSELVSYEYRRVKMKRNSHTTITRMYYYKSKTS